MTVQIEQRQEKKMSFIPNLSPLFMDYSMKVDWSNYSPREREREIRVTIYIWGHNVILLITIMPSSYGDGGGRQLM